MLQALNIAKIQSLAKLALGKISVFFKGPGRLPRHKQLVVGDFFKPGNRTAS
jgi:hypothetical protein